MFSFTAQQELVSKHNPQPGNVIPLCCKHSTGWCASSANLNALDKVITQSDLAVGAQVVTKVVVTLALAKAGNSRPEQFRGPPAL